MAAQGMILRNMALVGGQTKSGPMPPQHRPLFEEGVALVFGRWTALQLAIVNEWGGSSSREKAQQLLEDVIQWFYTAKDPDQIDLEDFLNEALQVDFNVQAEDDSPYQVARSLVNMHTQVSNGDASYIDSLRQQQPASAAACQNADGAAGADDDSSSSSDDEGSDDDDDDDDAMDAEGGEDMDMDDAPPPPPSTGPDVDEDGFQVVQRKGRGKQRN